MNESQRLILDTLCNTCNLNEYRETLKEIIGDIYSRGCKISLVKREKSSFRNQEQMGNCARIFLGYLNKKEPLDNIWALLKEFGNFTNVPIDTTKQNQPSYIFSREQFAWGFARDQIIIYPQLSTHLPGFTTYRVTNRYIQEDTFTG